MKILDIILIILLLIGAYSGYKKGLIIEIIGLVALILAIIGGLKLVQWGGEFLRNTFDIDSIWLPVITFILIFLIILLIVYSIGSMLKHAVHLTLLGSVDRLAGSVLGIIKWAFGLSVIIWFFSNIGFVFPEEMSANTFVYPQIYDFAPMVFGYLSSLFPFIGEVIKALAGNIK